MSPTITADGRTVEVEVVNEQSHHGRYVQVRATDPDVTLFDESGDRPWFDADELEGSA
jgi:hypothetical protein